MNKKSLSRIPVSEAAKLMKVSPQFVRVAMRQGILPIGTAVSISGGKYTYYISPELFKQYTGIEWPTQPCEN